ncbi:hypothetical protein P3T23_008654 [Paraburkholderia sp. GAS448]|uniref:hypothetical protein n=1 Tax=Paraburkholderia sp. GAS448 TaxID=3035136 RepID=UPI003D1FF7D8
MKAHDTQARVHEINGWKHRVIPRGLVFAVGFLIADRVRALPHISPDADFKRHGVMPAVSSVFICQIVSRDPSWILLARYFCSSRKFHIGCPSVVDEAWNQAQAEASGRSPCSMLSIVIYGFELNMTFPKSRFEAKFQSIFSY